jgi:glycosyltransferase involved in cell wall biosynthesis
MALSVPVGTEDKEKSPYLPPLRFLMLTHSVYARDIRVRRYSEYLAEEGHFVDIICLHSEDRGPQSSHPNIRVYPLPFSRARREGLALLMNWALTALMMAVVSTVLEIRRHYDIVHVHNMPDFLVFCPILARLRGSPVILNIHDPQPELARSKLGLPPDHYSIRAQLLVEKISISFSSHVITSTRVFKERLMARGVPEAKISIILNAPDPRVFRPSLKPIPSPTEQERFVILYVGTVAFRYGLSIAVEALPALRKAIPCVKLAVYTKIVHEGKALDACVQLARNLGVADLFEVHPPIPLEEMPALMQAADIGIYPAFKDCHMDDALSLKVPEMATVGLPIVATRLAVLEDIFGEEAIAFVPPGDPQALADKIIELYRKPELRKRLAENALKKAAVLDWPAQYKAYCALVESLVGRQDC